MADFCDTLNSFVHARGDPQTPHLLPSASQSRSGSVFQAMVGVWAGGILEWGNKQTHNLYVFLQASLLK